MRYYIYEACQARDEVKTVDLYFHRNQPDNGFGSFEEAKTALEGQHGEDGGQLTVIGLPGQVDAPNVLIARH